MSKPACTVIFVWCLSSPESWTLRGSACHAPKNYQGKCGRYSLFVLFLVFMQDHVPGQLQPCIQHCSMIVIIVWKVGCCRSMGCQHMKKQGGIHLVMHLGRACVCEPTMNCSNIGLCPGHVKEVARTIFKHAHLVRLQLDFIHRN